MPSQENLQVLLAHAKQNRLIESDLDGMIHDFKSAEATDINNGGFAQQLGYLIDKLGPTEAMTTIDNLIKEIR